MAFGESINRCINCNEPLRQGYGDSLYSRYGTSCPENKELIGGPHIGTILKEPFEIKSSDPFTFESVKVVPTDPAKYEEQVRGSFRLGFERGEEAGFKRGRDQGREEGIKSMSEAVIRRQPNNRNAIPYENAEKAVKGCDDIAVFERDEPLSDFSEYYLREIAWQWNQKSSRINHLPNKMAVYNHIKRNGLFQEGSLEKYILEELIRLERLINERAVNAKIEEQHSKTS